MKRVVPKEVRDHWRQLIFAEALREVLDYYGWEEVQPPNPIMILRRLEK